MPDLQEQVEKLLARCESEDERRELRDLFRKFVEECCELVRPAPMNEEMDTCQY